MREIRKIILHKSDSDVPAHDDIEVIRQWHTEPPRNWSDVGYHYYITKAGERQKGRDIARTGAHVAGHNADSVGICLGGKDDFTEDQFYEAGNLVRELIADINAQQEYQLTAGDIYGHCDFDEDKWYCPGFNVDEFIYKYY